LNYLMIWRTVRVTGHISEAAHADSFRSAYTDFQLLPVEERFQLELTIGNISVNDFIDSILQSLQLFS
jgi:hypothetical protein